MVEVQYRGPGPAERIANRLHNSGGHSDAHAEHGSGPTRTHTNIHHGGSQGSHGGGEVMNPLHPKDGDQ
jgi:hypothetical protein